MPHIKNPILLQKKIKKLKSDGADNLHIVSDFDRTLTKAFVNGEKFKSIYHILRRDKYLTPDYPEKAFALFDKFHRYEISTELSIEEKNVKMEEWWKAHYQLMVVCGINKKVIQNLATSGKIPLREGTFTFLDVVSKYNIPLLIFSAGMGDAIKQFLLHEGKLTPNVHIISNFYNFDSDGRVTGTKDRFIHTFNKHEFAVSDTPYYQDIKNRNNVILLGDSLGDLGMTEGIEHDTIIRIGFLNDNQDQFLEKYAESFDVVILEDGDMSYVNQLMQDIVG